MDAERLRDLFRQMLLVRRFEERLVELHDAGELPGHYHLYVGQEATGVAVVGNLTPDDVIYTTHRNHGHLLARGADPKRMLAEILGREGGYCRGRGGTLHIAVAELNVPATSASVGGSVPQAVGAAFALSRTRPGAVCTCFFGDGTFEEGAVYEAINIAALWQLPILLVCENNGAPEDQGAAGAFPTSSTAAERLTDIPAAFGVPSTRVDGTDLARLDATFAAASAEIRAGGGPRFFETVSSRWPGSRPLWPTLAGGRTRVEWITGAEDPPEEVSTWWRTSDPLRSAFRSGGLDAGWLADTDEAVTREIDEAVAWALDSERPAAGSLLDGFHAGRIAEAA